MNKIIKNLFAPSSIALLFSLVLFALCSCAVKERVAGVRNTFLEDVDINSKRPNLPFEHAWVDPQFKKSEFSAVYFKPIRLDLLPKKDWEKSASVSVTLEQDYFEKAKEIANYFRSELVEKTGSIEPKRLALSNSPGPDTVVIEIALTELELSHPLARAGSLAAPIPGAGAAISSITDPHVAFAARITDGASGKLIATAADRKFAPTRIVDLNKLTVSSNAREISALWADAIARAVQGDGSSKISEKKFDWMPW